MMRLSIPIMLPNGLATIEMMPSEYGDPYSVKITLPPECNGTVQLSRTMFSREMQDHMRRAFETEPHYIGALRAVLDIVGSGKKLPKHGRSRIANIVRNVLPEDTL